MKKHFLFVVVIAVIVFISACKSVSNFPIDEPSSSNKEDRLIGKWKFTEDTNKNNFYYVEKGSDYNPDQYHVQFWDRGGTNPTYEGNVYFSKINNSMFLNVPYPGSDSERRGFFFLRILEVNADYTKMTTATVADTALRSLKSEHEVRQLITRNINNPAFYIDTVHFYKVQ